MFKDLFNNKLTRWTATIELTGHCKDDADVYHSYEQRLDARVNRNGDLTIVRTHPDMFVEPVVAAYASGAWTSFSVDSHIVDDETGQP
jgi:hypothetical protein